MNLSIFKQQFGRVLLVVAIAVSLFVVYLGVHTLIISLEYATENAEIQSKNLALSISHNMTFTFKRIDHTLLSVAHAIERNLATGDLDIPRVKRILAAEEEILPEIVAIRVTDAEGRVILGNDSGDPSVRLADRPFFTYLRDHPEAGVFIAKPMVGKFTHKWVITSARRYNLSDGSFGGVVVAPVLVEQFQKALSGFNVGPGGLLTLRDCDGGFVTRYPEVVNCKTLAVGDATVSGELQAIIRSGVSNATFSARAPFDQMMRKLTFQRIEGTPYFILASLAEEDYLSEWKTDRAITSTIVMLFLAGVWIMVGFLWFFWKNRERDAETLRENANRLQAIVQTAMDGFWLVDLQGRLQEVNETYCRMSGYTRQELLTLRVTDMEAEETAEDTANHIRKVMTVGENRFETRHRRKDGSLFEVEISVQYLGAGGGMLVAFLRDITQRKQAEAKLAVVMKAVESTSDAIGISDAQGRHFYQNRALSDLFGYATAEELEKAGGGQAVVKSREVAGQMFQNIMSGKSWAGELEMVAKSGRVFPAYERADAIKDDKGNIVGLIGIITDITERKSTEDVLHLFKDLVEHSTDAIGMSTPEGFHYYQNKAFDRMFGDIGEHPLMAYVDEAAGKRVFETIMSGVRWQGELKMYGKDRAVLDIFVRAYAIRNHENRVIGLVGVHTDITERKRAEQREKDLQERLERAARMESLGVLAGGVAHDLNNVLGPIVGLPDMIAEYITRHGDPTDPDHEDTIKSIQAIKSSGQRAVSVVSDLVVMGRRGQFLQAPVDVNRVVEQLLDSKQIRALQSRRPDVHVSAQLLGEGLWCMGSDSRLVRVLANLVGNAAEAIDGQGNVVVSTLRKVFTEPCRGYEDVPAGEYVAVQVMDTGCGMDGQTIARIFEPFFSMKAPSERSGSGLGLSVVHGLVKDHAGFVDVKSAPGRGTTFTVYLPAVAAPEPRAASGNERLPEGREKILVVDDEVDQQFLTRRQLNKLGYAVTTVSSGEEAVALFEDARRAGRSAPFELVIMDMIMPGGMDGLSACKVILKVFPEEKILIMSGHAPEKYEIEVKALGIVWLPKPCQTGALAVAMRSCLDRVVCTVSLPKE